MSMATHLSAVATYNRWANERIVVDAGKLSTNALHRDVGIYFRSVFGTLVHLLNSDRAWLFLLQGGTLADMRVAAAPADLDEFGAARREQDRFFIRWLQEQDPAWFDEPFTFSSTLGSLAGKTYRGTHATALTHVFNHQCHHRGQIHAAMTILGIAEPLPLDMLVMGFADA